MIVHQDSSALSNCTIWNERQKWPPTWFHLGCFVVSRSSASGHLFCGCTKRNRRTRKCQQWWYNHWIYSCNLPIYSAAHFIVLYLTYTEYNDHVRLGPSRFPKNHQVAQKYFWLLQIPMIFHRSEIYPRILKLHIINVLSLIFGGVILVLYL